MKIKITHLLITRSIPAGGPANYNLRLNSFCMVNKLKYFLYFKGLLKQYKAKQKIQKKICNRECSFSGISKTFTIYPLQKMLSDPCLTLDNLLSHNNLIFFSSERLNTLSSEFTYLFNIQQNCKIAGWTLEGDFNSNMYIILFFTH